MSKPSSPSVAKGPDSNVLLYPTHYSEAEGCMLETCGGSIPAFLLELKRQNKSADARHIWWNNDQPVHAFFRLNGDELQWRWDAINGFTIWDSKAIPVKV